VRAEVIPGESGPMQRRHFLMVCYERKPLLQVYTIQSVSSGSNFY
jgi:hypothetical protein